MNNHILNDNKVLYSINHHLQPLPDDYGIETQEKQEEEPKQKKKVTVPIKKPVKSDNLKGYLPNISYSHSINDSRLFDLAIEKGTKLSDGSTILRPISENPAFKKNAKLVPSSEKGKYDVVSTAYSNGSAYRYVDAVLTEQQVKENPFLYAGQIKKVDDNKYEITHFNDKKEPVTETLNFKECLNILRAKHSII